MYGLIARRGTVILALCLTLALTLSACGTFEVGVVGTPASPPTASVGAEDTSVPPRTATVGAEATTELPTPSPVETGTTIAAPTPAQDATIAPVKEVEVYLVAVGDDGQSGKRIGCGDSLIPVKRAITPTTDPLRSALEELLAIRQQFYGESGLYNALYQSDLHVESIQRDGSSTTVRLQGQTLLGGVCDNPRFEAQIMETARQFQGVGEVAVFINDVPLQQVISLKGS